MSGHFDTKTVFANAFYFFGLVDSFWHGDILSFPHKLWVVTSGIIHSFNAFFLKLVIEAYVLGIFGVVKMWISSENELNCPVINVD